MRLFSCFGDDELMKIKPIYVNERLFFRRKCDE